MEKVAKVVEMNCQCGGSTFKLEFRLGKNDTREQLVCLTCGVIFKEVHWELEDFKYFYGKK